MSPSPCQYRVLRFTGRNGIFSGRFGGTIVRFHIRLCCYLTFVRKILSYNCLIFRAFVSHARGLLYVCSMSKMSEKLCVLNKFSSCLSCSNYPLEAALRGPRKNTLCFCGVELGGLAAQRKRCRRLRGLSDVHLIEDLLEYDENLFEAYLTRP